jgi:hypothetical protein
VSNASVFVFTKAPPPSYRVAAKSSIKTARLPKMLITLLKLKRVHDSHER